MLSLLRKNREVTRNRNRDKDNRSTIKPQTSVRREEREIMCLRFQIPVNAKISRRLKEMNAANVF